MFRKYTAPFQEKRYPRNTRLAREAAVSSKSANIAEHIRGKVRTINIPSRNI